MTADEIQGWAYGFLDLIFDCPDLEEFDIDWDDDNHHDLEPDLGAFRGVASRTVKLSDGSYLQFKIVLTEFSG